MRIAKADLHILTDKALDAFWQIVVTKFPQAETGDLSIDLTCRLEVAAQRAIEEWIDLNVPPIEALR